MQNIILKRHLLFLQVNPRDGSMGSDDESPRNENGSVCSKGVSDPWFRAGDSWRFCKRGSRCCSEATSTAPYVVLRHTNAFSSNGRIRNCSPPCLLFSIKNVMHFSLHNRTYHLVSHDINYNLIFFFYFFFYSLHSGWLLRNLQKRIVLKITSDPFCRNITTLSCHSLDFQSSLIQVLVNRGRYSITYQHISQASLWSVCLPHKTRGI